MLIDPKTGLLKDYGPSPAPQTSNKMAFGWDDAAMLAIGGLSQLFGGGNDQQKRVSYSGKGIVDPVQSLRQALEVINRAGAGFANSRSGPVRLRSSYVPPPMNPISIPGLPFQIGGGLGRDPALDNPALLESYRNNDWMKGLFDQATSPTSVSDAQTKKRPPQSKGDYPPGE